MRSAGLDVLIGLVHEGEWTYSADAEYSYMSAVDRTPDSYTFGQQVPYIARHTVVLRAALQWKDWALIPLWQIRAGRSDGYGELPSWNTLDVTLAKSFNIRGARELKLSVSARNILDCRYETVSGYPMPGRNVTGGVEFKF